MMSKRKDRQELLAAVEDATLAPSIHNSQPWRFVAGPHRVEVWFDLQRRPTVVDTEGRWAMLSLGAALANLELGLRCRLQRPVQVELLSTPFQAPEPLAPAVPPALARFAAAPSRS